MSTNVTQHLPAGRTHVGHRPSLSPRRASVALLVAALAMLSSVACESFSINPAGIRAGITAVESVADAFKGINESNQYYYGRAISASILGTFPSPDYEALSQTPDDPTAAAHVYLNKVGGVVAQVSGRPNMGVGWWFGTLQTDQVLAFSAPGGFVFVSTGLIAQCETEDQLAAVIAHEIAHVCELHGLGAMGDEQKRKAVQDSLRAAGSLSDNDKVQMAAGFGEAVGEAWKNILAGYSREYEMTADLLGLTYLYRAGYDPGAMAEILDRLVAHDAAAGESQEGDWRATHPPSTDRLAAVETLIADNGLEGTTSETRTARFMSHRDNFHTE